MHTDNVMIQGNLALKVESQDKPRLCVIPGGRSFGQRHARPSFSSLLVLVFTLLITFSLFTVSTLRSRATFNAAANTIQYHTIRVAQGDSLWSLAENHPVENLSTQETCDIIRSENHLSHGGIDAGMYLKVPDAR